MKKLLFTSILAFMAITIYAQETIQNEEKPTGKNEIRLNLLNTIVGIPEISYERLFSDNSSTGISVLVGIDDDTDYKFGVIPYYRVYFGNNVKQATGFFIEANAAVMQVKDDRYYLSYDGNGNWHTISIDKNMTSFGVGAAAGGKFLTRNDFVGEVYIGVGRFFGKKKEIEAYPRVGITIGKRF